MWHVNMWFVNKIGQYAERRLIIQQLCLTHTIVSINWAVANLERVNSENASTNEPKPCNSRKTRLRKSISWWNCGAWWSKLQPRMMPRRIILLQRPALIQILVWISVCPNTRTRTGEAPHDARTRTQRSTDYQPIIWNLTLYYESENHTVTPLKLLANCLTNLIQ